MRLIPYLSAVLLLLISSCRDESGRHYSGDEIVYIQGNISQGAGNAIRIQKILPDEFITLDSLVVGDDNSFTARIEIEDHRFFAIRNEGDNYISFIAKPGDSIQITADYYNFNNFNMSGTEDVREITRLHKATRSFLDEIAEYARIVTDSVSSPDYTDIKLEIDKKYRAAFNELKYFSEQFIERNEGSLVTLLALTNQLGQDFFVFHPVKDFDTFRKVDSVLINKYPESEAVKKIHSQVEMVKMRYPREIDQPEPGEKAPDFAISTPSGKKNELSDFRGRYLLLDFWASWCAPCRKENEKLVSLYKDFHSKGFEIFQISLDNSHDEWLNAIEKDELDWPHGSELNFWDSSVAELYGVNSIPANYLIDPEGKIIAKNLSPEEVRKKLKDFYN